MSEALAVIQPNKLALNNSIDFNSKLFQLKPATIKINQRMTEAPGATLGKLRIAETGDQFDKMVMTLLAMPKEYRQYHVGNKPTPETLMCYSREGDGDLLTPGKDARVPQALDCSSCKHNDKSNDAWARWRESKRAEDAPKCASKYYAVFIDTVYKMPLQMFIQGTSRKPFEAGTQAIARKLQMLQAQGGQPNIWDVRFTLKPVLHTDNKTYILNMSEFEIISPEERVAFGEIYTKYVGVEKTIPVAEPAKEDVPFVEAELVDEDIVF